jgi:hypothetical protein
MGVLAVKSAPLLWEERARDRMLRSYPKTRFPLRFFKVSSAVHFKEEGMRAIAACCLALGLIALPALAKAGGAGDGDKDSAAAVNARNAVGATTQPSNSSTTVSTNAPAAKAEVSSMESELQELRELLGSQAKQLQEQQQQMQLLEEKLDAANLARENLASAPADPTAVGPTPPVASGSLANAQPNQDKAGPPTSINIKGISLTPVGFMAAETVWRQKALASDVNTPFNANIFPGNSAAHTSEFNASGRQSRIGMLVEGKLDHVQIGGFYEMDFLSAGVTSNNNQSNSYTMRQRQFWAQAAFNNGFTVTGGQQWSLLTETTKGLDNRSEALPQTIDAQYMVGFSWARQFGFRVTKNFGNKVWLGFAVEEPQATLTVHGNPTAVSGGTAVCTTPACTTTTTVNAVTNNNFLLGAFGTSGGLYNPLGNYAYNPSPDFVLKAAFEPGFGHYEIFGVLSDFRDRVFPCVPLTGTTPPPGCSSITSAAGAFNDNRAGGGIGANARWAFLNKHVDLGIHFFGGSGIGRYGSAGLSDATVRPDGTIALIHNFQSLGTLQFHPMPKLDINLNLGGEFEARTAYIKSGASPNEGYGYLSLNNSGCWTETLPIAAPGTGNNLGVPTGVGGSTGFIPGTLGSCTADTRNIIEGSIGFWYRFYKGQKGTVQWGAQYANYVRNTWRGVGGASGTVSASGQPHSDQNMIFTSFRYVLP